MFIDYTELPQLMMSTKSSFCRLSLKWGTIRADAATREQDRFGVRITRLPSGVKACSSEKSLNIETAPKL